MTPTLIPFEPHHLDAFECREWRDGDREAGKLAWNLYRGIGWSAVVDGKIIGAGGMILVRPGIVEPWLEISDEAARYKFWLTRTSLKMGLQAMAELGAEKIEVWPEVKARRNIAWLKHFGFARCWPVQLRKDFRGRTFVKYAMGEISEGVSVREAPCPG